MDGHGYGCLKKAGPVLYCRLFSGNGEETVDPLNIGGKGGGCPGGQEDGFGGKRLGIGHTVRPIVDGLEGILEGGVNGSRGGG